MTENPWGLLMHTLPAFFTLNYNHLHEVIRVLNSCLPPLRPGLHFDQYLTKVVGLNCISITTLWLSSELNGTIQMDPNYCFNVVSCCSAFQSIHLNVILWMTLGNNILICITIDNSLYNNRLICIRSHIQAKLSPVSTVVLSMPD